VTGSRSRTSAAAFAFGEQFSQTIDAARGGAAVRSTISSTAALLTGLTSTRSFAASSGLAARLEFLPQAG